MSRYTPGPWRTASYDNGLTWKVETAKDRRAVASYVAGLVGECEANARLIASAPELLAALCNLSRAVQSASPLDVGVMESALAHAEEVIAEATR